MRKWSILIILFTSTQIYSQVTNELKSQIRTASNSELSDYVSKAKSQGISIEEATKVIEAQGGSKTEIELLKRLWGDNNLSQNNSKSNNLKSNNSKSIKSNIGFKVRSDSIPFENYSRFASDFFNNNDITETPQVFLATPQEYRLGPGDEIMINIFGSIESTFLGQISREGNIKLERLSPIYLSGLSLKSAKNKLKNNLSKIYPSLNSNNDSIKANIDLSLVKARSIVVNIVGSIKVPGTYTISGFSSVLNALYLSGGPNNIGTYRNIEIVRAGEKIKNIDLYSYFSKGIFPSFYLRDQDVIFVPPLKKQVILKEGFKINKKFELLDSENFKDILFFSGGFNSSAFKEKIYVERINGIKIDYEDIDYKDYESSFPLDGDVISAKIPNEFYSNKVSISGSVLLPGNYSLKNNRTIEDLISNSGGLTRDALLKKAFLYRQNRGINNELISINLNQKKNLKTSLKVLDSLVIISSKDIESEKFITVIGEVLDPKTLPFKDKMTTTDALVLSGGFLESADKKNVQIFRNISNRGKGMITEVKNITFKDNFSTDNNFLLKHGDVISVSKQPNFKEVGYFSVSGEVLKETSYAIENDNQTVADVFKFIQFRNSANIRGVYLERSGIKVPIKFNKNNIIVNNLNLKPGDNIVVPTNDNSVKIVGEVQNEIIIPYEKKYNLSDYISFSGGYTNSASKKDVYISYANGSSKNISKFIGFRLNPSILPGSTIIVPTREKKERTNLGEIIGITSSLASLIALVQLVSQN